MDKRQALEIIKLLSALESWSFSADKPVPGYLLERIWCLSLDLSDQILKGDLDVENVRD